MAVVGIIEAKLRYYTVYECAACDNRQRGATTNDIYRGSRNGLHECLDNLPQRSAEMPVGWSYNGEFNCGCNKEKVK